MKRRMMLSGDEYQAVMLARSEAQASTQHEPKPTKSSIHARTAYCPNCSESLTHKNLSDIEAMKGCLRCKRRFVFLRTDTLAGRAERARRDRAAKKGYSGLAEDLDGGLARLDKRKVPLDLGDEPKVEAPIETCPY